MSLSSFTEIQPVPVSQVSRPHSDVSQAADYSQSIFVAIAAIASFLLGASKTYLVILPFARRVLPKSWTGTQIDDYVETFASCIIQLSPSLSQVDKLKIKGKITDPTETAKLVLDKPEEVIQKLSEQTAH